MSALFISTSLKGLNDKTVADGTDVEIDLGRTNSMWGVTLYLNSLLLIDTIQAMSNLHQRRARMLLFLTSKLLLSAGYSDFLQL